MLSTDEEAKLSLFNGELIISPFVNWESKSKDWEKGDGVNQHLYIISDEKIEEGSYFLSDKRERKSQNNGLPIWEIKRCAKITNSWIFAEGNPHEGLNPEWCKKIIATTDSSLYYYPKEDYNGRIKKLLPQPSQQFIEKYIEEYNKGNVITEVMVEYEELWKSTVYDQPDNYIGEALKVNPKDNTINIMLIKDSWNWKELKALFDSYGDNHAAQIIWNDIQNL